MVDAGRYAANPSDVLQLIVRLFILDVHDQPAHRVASWVAIFVHVGLGSLDVHKGRRFRHHQDTLFLIIDITPFIKVLALH